MFNSYERFYAKLSSEGLFDPRERDMHRGYNSQINNGNVFALINVTVKYLNQNGKDLTFTEEEIKDFLERHSVDDGEGNVSYKVNETTKSLKDYILLTLAQDQMKSVRNAPLLKYLEVCHPVIFNSMPFIKDTLADRKEAQKARGDNRKPFLRLRQHKNLASLLGK